MRFRKIIEQKYTDRATVSRMEDYKTGSGETRQRLVEVYSDEPCRLSQKALASNNQREPFNQIDYETKLFISPDVKIKQGDTIIVTRRNVTKTFKAGEPFPYHSHQEISLERKGKA